VEKVRAERARLKKGAATYPYESFTDWLRDAAGVITVPVARFLARLGFHPDTLTLLGTLLNVGVAALLGMGYLSLGGWMLVLVAPLDALDGALARVVGRRDRFGAFLDSTMDRVAEAALLAGLAAHYFRQGAMAEVVLAFIALAGANLVSYTRARAEGLGVSCKIGLLTRVERIAVLVVGLILGLPRAALWILAVGSVATAVQRILYVRRRMQEREARTLEGERAGTAVSQ